MTEAEIVSEISAIPVGRILAWVAVVAAVIIGVYKVCRYAYKISTNVNKILDTYKQQEEKSNTHEQKLQKLQEELSVVKESLYRFEDDRLAQKRYDLVKAGETCLERGTISIRELKAISECYEQYKRPGRDGVVHNGYVATLMEKVSELPVTGQLDEHGRDI